MKQRKPKYKKGDSVTMMKPDLNGDYVGEVIDVERIYKKVHEGTDKIDRSGLVTMESMIENICLVHRFDGETLEVDYPEKDHGNWIQKAKTEKSIFYGYVVSVHTNKMTTLINEKYVM